MAVRSKTRCIGVLTSGGDCPGLNAAIRAVATGGTYFVGEFAAVVASEADRGSAAKGG